MHDWILWSAVAAGVIAIAILALDSWADRKDRLDDEDWEGQSRKF
ncbi:hypothetical protein [Mesorhizobium sp. CA4]|nr:hypothetical protein [Mesorhizobium sp. CA4]